MPTLSQSKTLLLELLALLALSAALGAVLNLSRPAPLPWLGSGAPEAATAPAPVAEAGTEAPGEPAIPEIDTPQALALLAEGKALFVDARFAEDFAAGHIPGAVNVPPGMFEDEIKTLLGEPEQARPLVLYCSSLTCPMSHELALGLDYAGYQGISVFSAGMVGWVEAGGAVEVAQ